MIVRLIRISDRAFTFLRKASRRQKQITLWFVDVLISLLAFVGASVLVDSGYILTAAPTVFAIQAFFGMIFVGVLGHFSGLTSIRPSEFESHAISVAAGVTASMTLSLLALDMVLPLGVGPSLYLLVGALFLLGVVISRAAMFQIINLLYRSNGPRRRVLIYGAGTTGTQLASALNAHHDIDPIAFVDDNISLQGMKVMGLPVHAAKDVPALVQKLKIDRVLLAMPSLAIPVQMQLARRLQSDDIVVQALPSFAQLIGEEGLIDKLATVSPKNYLERDIVNVALTEANSKYANRSVLVSGAGGSIGSELCRQVLSCGPRQIVLFELSEFALYSIEKELRPIAQAAGVTLIPILGSVTDPRQVRKVLGDFDVQVVLHAAAYKHVPMVEANPLSGLANNVFGTQTLAQCSAELGVERFILVSSDKAVRPANIMGASKRLAELVVHDFAKRYPDTIFSMVRFGNVLGSSGSVIPLFQEQVRRGGPVTVTDPRITRYFMAISEAVQLVLQAAAYAEGGEVFVLDMGEPVSIMHLARQVITTAGYTVRDAANPDGEIEIEITGLRPGEKLTEELTSSENLHPTGLTKIYTAEEETLSEIEVAQIMRSLRQALAHSDENQARDVIKRWVQGYRSVGLTKTIQPSHRSKILEMTPAE